MGKKSKRKLPERWTEYSAIGDVIPGTPFIAFKVPLKPEYFSGVQESERFTTQDLLHKLKGKLKVVIDLSYKGVGLFYDPEDLECNGIKYEKLFTAGHVVPSNEIVRRFTSIVKNNLVNNPKDKFIGVHCTHGVNRTGYLITRYMVENLNFTAEDAQAAFEKGRGYPMERKNYIDSLHQIERSVKNQEFNLSPANENQAADNCNITHGATECSIPPLAWNNCPKQGGCFYSESYEEPYSDEYNWSYCNDYYPSSRTRPPVFNSHQSMNFNNFHWQNSPSDSSFHPHGRYYDDCANIDYNRRGGRYRPYEQYGSYSGMHNRTNRSRYHWSKADRTNSRSATQHKHRNFSIRKPKGSHMYFE